ncbi:MAG: hypothetical protein K9M15_02240 [Candidatus Marinimicrobia bacterium]|nr:hypothetical protein [Candidatus Neomarinimicrobiota bacterium]
MFVNLDYVYGKIYDFFVGGFNFFVGSKAGFLSFLFWVKIFAVIFSLVCVAGIVYSFMKLLDVRRQRVADFVKTALEEPSEEREKRWDKIKKYIETNNSSDWKMAIMEADSLLDEMIKNIGYEGEGLGERLTKIKKVQLNSLDDAWEAHKVRNKIAHEGNRYEITKNKAEKTIELYENVFKELGYI